MTTNKTEMSGTEPEVTLWCLVDGEEIPFSVDASPILFIDQLKSVINEIKTDLQAPAYELDLWKPKREIPVKPSDTLAQRLNELGLDLSQMAEWLEPADTVEDYFQTLTPTSSHLDILVKLPPPPTPRDIPPHKRPRLTGDFNPSRINFHDSALEALQQFWESLWQDHKDPFREISVQRGLNPVQSVDVPATMKVLLLPMVISGIGNVMIRDEYDEAMEYIENLRTSRIDRPNRDVVIAGHPGIGKSILYYILVKRLLEKKPTVFQNHSDYVIIFNDAGFQLERAFLFMDPGQSTHQDTWALVDMSPDLDIQTLAAFIKSSPFFTVIASSPNPSLWDIIMRYRGPFAFWFMKPFCLAELIQARQLQGYGHKETDIEKFFEMYGPSARDCYTFCHNDDLGMFNSAVRRKIKQMSWKSLTEILTWETEGVEIDEGPDMVVLVGPQPNNRAAPRTVVVTDTVSQLLWERYSNEQWGNHHQLFSRRPHRASL